MAGDLRGHDLDSWWQNRAAFRDDANLAIDQWRMAAANLSQASRGAKQAGDAAPWSETLASLNQAGQAILSGMQAATMQLTSLSGERGQVQTEFAAEQGAVDSDCRRRVQAANDRAMEQAHASAERAAKGKVMLRKLIAAVIFIAVLYVIVRY